MIDTPSQSRTSTTDVETLGEEIATLAAQIHAATYRLLVLLAEFDQREGWATGFRSCAHWLHWRTGIALGASREKVRVARALRELPLLSAEMERGRISYSKVRALTRVATAQTEEELVNIAQATTASQVERIVASWRRFDDAAELREANRRHLFRYASIHEDEDGMVIVEARLEPEAGAVLKKALEAAEEKIYRKTKEDSEGNVVPAGQRRADALVVVAESALAGGLDPGTSGDRYQVVVHVTEDAPASDVLDGARSRSPRRRSIDPAPGRGVDVSAETSGEVSVKRRLPR